MDKFNYSFYDSIDNMATRWLAWNLDKKKKIGFSCLDARPRSLWVLCMARNLYTYCETIFYVKAPLLVYLNLRYIKKFKFIRRYNKKKHQDVFLIDSIDFIEDVTAACNTVPETIDRIYEIYYKR